MATVPIPWFTGAPVGGVSPYMGKAMRQRRQLQAMTQGLYDVGALWRKERSKGLPPGATDEDLANEELRLEEETKNAQSKAQQDATHPVERATTQGDHQSAQAIKDDPASYADAKHEESQGLLPQLGNFMKSGIERLVWGDPKRQERLQHIQRMKGELAREKDKENFFKTAGQVCMKSEDPEACLRAAGGERYGITKLPKSTQKSLADVLGPGGQDITPPPSKSMGGSPQFRMDWDQATEDVRRAHGGKLPDDQNVVRRETEAAYENRVRARQKAKDDDQEKRRRSFYQFKEAAAAVREAARDARRAADKAGTTVSESWTDWKDSQGGHYQMDDVTGERMQRLYPNLGLTKVKVTTRRKEPDQPAAGAEGGEPPAATAPEVRGKPSRVPDTADPGTDEFGVPFYAPVVPQQ